MRIWLAQIGGGGTTRHIDELIALAHAYQDNLREAIRISYEVGPNEHQFTYALVINLPIDRTVVWVPYCSQNTTDYSGEGGAGRQRIEEAVLQLMDKCLITPAPVASCFIHRHWPKPATSDVHRRHFPPNWRYAVQLAIASRFRAAFTSRS